MPNVITRSAKTQRLYDNRVKTTMHRYQAETGHTWADHPMAFAEWMLAQKRRWKRSTWRMTRLAVQEYLQEAGAPIEAIQHFDDGHNPSSKAAGQFAAVRVKGFPDSDLEKLVTLLTSPLQGATPSPAPAKTIRSGGYDVMLAAFLQANVLIGLRPSEWDTAHWVTLNEERVLQVENRKTTNGRSNGTARLLCIHPDKVDLIQAALTERDRLLAMGAAWPEIQNGMACRIKEIRHLVTKKTYTLYSTRHRFVSAAKQSGYSKEEIANMLGHASENTATMHYGRKTAKTSGGRGETAESLQAPALLVGVTRGVGVTIVPKDDTENQAALTEDRGNTSGTANPDE